MLPACMREPILQRMEWRSALHAVDIAGGFGRVEMPTALERMFPNADHEFARQFVIASNKLSRCPCGPGATRGRLVSGADYLLFRLLRLVCLSCSKRWRV